MGEREIIRRRKPRGREIIIVIVAVAIFLIMFVAPLITVIWRSLANGIETYISAVTSEYTISALRLTLFAAAIAVVVSAVVGICASWLITKFSFRGQNVLLSLIDIPYSVSPVIAGLAFIMMFGRTGWATPAVEWINNLLGTDISLVFSVPGVVLATIFVTFPYVCRELIPTMQAQGSSEEEAAVLFGTKGLRIFTRVTFPHIKWALLYGIILCAARAFGEFGAVYAVSKTRGETFTLPLEVDALYMSGGADSIAQAFAVSSVLVMLALAMLILRQIVEFVSKKQEEKKCI